MRAIMAAILLAGLSFPAQAQVVKEIISIQQGLQTILQFTEPFSAASVGDSSVLDAARRPSMKIRISV